MKKIYVTLLFGLFALVAQAVSVTDIAGSYKATFAQYADAMGAYNDPKEVSFTVTTNGNTVTFSGLLAKDFSGTFDAATNTISVAEGAATSSATIAVEDGVLLFGVITPTDEYAIPGIFAVKEGATPAGTAYDCTLDYQAVDFTTWQTEDKTAKCTVYLVFGDDGKVSVRNFFGMSSLVGTVDAETGNIVFPTDYVGYTYDMSDFSASSMDLVLKASDNGYAALDKAGSASILGFYFVNLTLSKAGSSDTGLNAIAADTTEQEVYTLGGVRVDGGSLKGLYIVRQKGQPGRVVRY